MNSERTGHAAATTPPSPKQTDALKPPFTIPTSIHRMDLPREWGYFNTPTGAVISWDETGAHEESDQIALTSQHIPGAWVHVNRSWTTVSPFSAQEPAEHLDPATERVLREQVADLQERLKQALGLLESERIAHREMLLNMSSVEDIDDAIDPNGFNNDL